MADTPFTNFAYAVTGGTVNRTTPDRAADIVNVKEYGAVGDGNADDTTPIQNAIYAAYGNPSSQGTPFSNRVVWFPAGNYSITAPLKLINIIGAVLRGAGNGSSQIICRFTGTEGNSVSSEYPNVTPAIITDGLGYGLIEDLDITTTSAPSLRATYQTSGSTANGNSTLHFADTTGIVVGDSIYDLTNRAAIPYLNGTGAVVAAVPNSTTVTMSTPATGTGVGSGDFLHIGRARATNGSTASGNAVLHFADTTGIAAGMNVYNATQLGVNIGYVVTKDATTVTCSSGASATINSGDQLIFANSTIGIYFYQSGSNGYTGGCVVQNVNIANFAIGVLGGSPPGNCDNCSMVNVQFNNCAFSGLRVIGANAVNWRVIGGGISNCGYLSTGPSGNLGAGYSVPTGSICAIIGMSNTNGGDDAYEIINAGAQGMAVIAGRSESLRCMAAVGSSISVVEMVYGGGDPSGCLCFDCTANGNINCVGLNFGPTNLTSTLPLAARGNHGRLSISGFGGGGHDVACVITGAGDGPAVGGSQVWIKDQVWTGARSSSFYSGFTGTVMEDDYYRNVTVADLPTAHAKFAGLRASVTDANATTYASNVAASGTNLVNVYCGTANGSTYNWKIG